MIYLLELLDIIPPRIVGGDKYSWLCYGDNARYLDMERNVDIIFDEKTHVVYEISIRGNADDGVDTDALWRSPAHEKAYLNELKENRKLDDDELNAKKANVYDINEMIEKVRTLYESGGIF